LAVEPVDQVEEVEEAEEAEEGELLAERESPADQTPGDQAEAGGDSPAEDRETLNEEEPEADLK
jgi:hypothetical protein